MKTYEGVKVYVLDLDTTQRWAVSFMDLPRGKTPRHQVYRRQGLDALEKSLLLLSGI
jgi:hypothetical protein